MKNSDKIRTEYIRANPQKCTACGACIHSCPKQVIGKVGFLWHKHITFKNAENCIGCNKCIQVCPHGVFNEEIPGKLKDILDTQNININSINRK
jgi:ferredoxin